MKKLPSVKAIMAITVILMTICAPKVTDSHEKIYGISNQMNNNLKLLASVENRILLKEEADNTLLAINEKNKVAEEVEEKKEEQKIIVYEGMTLEELAAKLDKNLKSTLKGYGMVFANNAIKYEVDPYLALAIVLHETGCDSGKCSSLTSQCNNIGGMKGKNTCGNGSYAKFPSLNAGIEAFFKNLSTNYYKKGLTTPEKIGKKYAESSNWATRVKYYIQKIKKS